MAKVNWEPGDRFRFEPAVDREVIQGNDYSGGYRYGIVLLFKKSFVIAGSGGRRGWRPVRLSGIPKSALPVSDAEWMSEVPYEVKLALQSVKIAIL